MLLLSPQKFSAGRRGALQSLKGISKRFSFCENPQIHLRAAKNYLQTSPIRCKEKLLELRLHKHPGGHARAVSLLSPIKAASLKLETEKLIKRTSTLIKTEKELNFSLQKNCTEKFKRRINSLLDREVEEFFSECEKDQACQEYTTVQKKINGILRGRLHPQLKIQKD